MIKHIRCPKCGLIQPLDETWVSKGRIHCCDQNCLHDCNQEPVFALPDRLLLKPKPRTKKG